ncbi:MAG: ABC transporter substrate-binding protein [Actinobacteria bacterium]|nr:ABC transporter substrate-binding protein [Actinomycetota bacterium]MCL5447319.1 ABC transporter substrate-binding protein [Actinomycetota bacterium]
MENDPEVTTNIDGASCTDTDSKVSRFDRRRFLHLAAGAGAVGVGGPLLLSSCSSSRVPSTSTGETPLANAISSLPPKRGGSLVVGIDSEQAGFNPTRSPWSSSGIMYARALFDPLTILMADGTIRPYLAQALTPSPDYATWTITMRPDVLFHDGTPCDAAAVAYNIDAFRKSFEFSVFTTNIKHVKATGSLTLEVEMNEPWVSFPAQLTGALGAQLGWVVAPSMLRAKNGASNPVGTGPFRFVEWIPNDHMKASRNQSYWRKGMPYLDEIEYKPIPSSASRSASLRSGALDIMHTDTTAVIVTYQHNPDYSYIDDAHSTIGEPDVNFVMLNMSKPPFNDIRVRQAMAYATDVSQMNAVVANSLPELATGPFFPGSKYYAPTGYPQYDLAKAKSLIRQVESETGKPVSFEHATTAANTTESELSQLFQSMWQAAGMKVTLAYYDEVTLIQNAISGKYQADSWTQFAAPDPDCNWPFWHYPSYGNFTRNDDPELNAYLHTGRTNPDPAARAAAYQGVAKRFAVDLPYIWTNRGLWAIIGRPNVMNFANPTAPNGGHALGMEAGVIWPTQIWLKG